MPAMSDLGFMDRLYVRHLQVRHAARKGMQRLRPRRFSLDGRQYAYAAHMYNTTWLNERGVEVALGHAFLDENAGRRVLELGNVMSHYGRTDHEVVDKYEQAPGVRNVDVVDLDPAEPYDAVLSLSTIEHVGQDEEPCEPEKALGALDRLIALTARDGDLMVTFPVGHNRALDNALAEDRLPFATVSCLRRVDAANTWKQVSKDELADVAYGHPFRQANGLVVCRGRGA
jgi:hypothetical protein